MISAHRSAAIDLGRMLRILTVARLPGRCNQSNPSKNATTRFRRTGPCINWTPCPKEPKHSPHLTHRISCGPAALVMFGRFAFDS